MERCAQRRAEGNALVSNADYEAAKAMYDKALQVHFMSDWTRYASYV